MRARIKGAAAFFQHDASGGVVLLLAVLAAMVIDNSPAAGVRAGSVLSALIGYAVLRASAARPRGSPE